MNSIGLNVEAKIVGQIRRETNVQRLCVQLDEMEIEQLIYYSKRQKAVFEALGEPIYSVQKMPDVFNAKARK